ncbi:hypothetical protein BJ912DRAFT_976201 [Pholiota molesta]|nr:hypothetical protein BJ912DRAFT_976201 [Pholiota molesta]
MRSHLAQTFVLLVFGIRNIGRLNTLKHRTSLGTPNIVLDFRCWPYSEHILLVVQFAGSSEIESEFLEIEPVRYYMRNIDNIPWFDC